MATRGGVAAAATAIASNVIFRQTSRPRQSILSLPRYFRQRFNNSRSVQRFASLPGRGSLIRAVNEATIDRVSNKMEEEEQRPDQEWKIKMLYDGDCPLCMREVNMLKERNKRYGTIKFVDISSNQYSPEENQGLDYETVMGRIHAILTDGTVVTDVEAFRRLYENVGLGWVYAITKYEPIASIADAVYGVWAKNRLIITGRPPLEQVLEARKRNKDELCKDKDACKM